MRRTERYDIHKLCAAYAPPRVPRNPADGRIGCLLILAPWAFIAIGIAIELAL